MRGQNSTWLHGPARLLNHQQNSALKLTSNMTERIGKLSFSMVLEGISSFQTGDHLVWDYFPGKDVQFARSQFHLWDKTMSER